MARKMTKTLQERILMKLRPSEDTNCLLFTGYRNNWGYGKIRVGGKTKVVHRVVWEEVNGSIPESLCVLHTCDVPACCLPAHLFLGTHADNMKDMSDKARGRNGRSTRTNCPRGHPYNEENTYIHTKPNGRVNRHCIVCKRDSLRNNILWSI
jgi:hypothetical protein